MRSVFISSDNIVSPLGFTSAENFKNLRAAVSGVKKHDRRNMSEFPFYASLFDEDSIFSDAGSNNGFTRFEQLLATSIEDALSYSHIKPSDTKTIFILSSTKGNISLLETGTDSKEIAEEVSLQHSAKKIAAHFGFVNKPVVVSNACISGLMAMIIGMRFIQSGKYDHAVVAGADVISKFILSGFQSFQAVSNEPCKPFDASRNGINLGEAAGTIVLSADKYNSSGIRMCSGSVSNDANHISGPSRTGAELFQAIDKALQDAGLHSSDIDFISAHGTATVYNDEMESKAINLAGMPGVPVNSLKGYYGHTLGAAGLIEAIACVHSLRENVVLPTPGFTELGVPMPLNICSTLTEKPLRHCLKTASGFGGCNAAVVLSKDEI